jgi:hypothetical protein
MTALLCAGAGCTQGGDDQSSDPPTSTLTTTTGATITLTRPDARFVATLDQLRGGVPRAKRGQIRQAVAEPIRAWFDQAFLEPAYPTADFPKAFESWTRGATQQAQRDRDITTNAALGRDIVAVVADAQRAKLYVFATRGVTGGATAQVRLRLTGERSDGTLVSYTVWGRLYLTRDKGTWSIFGYHLERAVAP